MLLVSKLSTSHVKYEYQNNVLLQRTGVNNRIVNSNQVVFNTLVWIVLSNVTSIVYNQRFFYLLNIF